MNNAGVMAVPQAKTVDGFETQFAINVLGKKFLIMHALFFFKDLLDFDIKFYLSIFIGHFLLTHLLMEQVLAAAPGSRIINLSSAAHHMVKTSFGNRK